mgnify:FL=1|jgi:LacI family transcriptional regulator
MKPTIVDIAKELNLSPSTVSRALKNNPRISIQTKNKVIQTAKKMNYLHEEDIALCNRIILIIIANPQKSVENDEFFSVFLQGALEGSKKESLHCLVQSIRSKESYKRALLPVSKVNGIILCGIPMPEELITFIKRLDIPCVQIGNYKGLEAFTSINNDNHRGGQLVGKTVLDKGYKNISIITGSLSLKTFKDRIDGFISVVRNDEAVSYTIHECSDFDEKSGYGKTIELFKNQNLKEKQCIFCTTDWLAKGALNSLEEMKVPVPESIGVIGYGNLSFSSYLKPPLTTVALNPYLLGRLGITMLNEKMDCNPNLSSTVFIEPIITLRQSL